MRAILVTLIILLLLAVTVPGQVPPLLNYQGHLVDGGGSALDTVVAITFTIYDDSLAGDAVWSEAHASVTVTEGSFTVLLGSVVALDDSLFAHPDRYLGIAVGGDPEITPRTRLVSVPYALTTASLRSVGGGADTVQIDPSSGFVLRATDLSGTERITIETTSSEGPMITVRHPGGRYTTLGTGDSSLCVYGSDGNLRMRIGLSDDGRIDGGGAVSVMASDGGVAAQLNTDGLFIYDDLGTDTVMSVLRTGDIRGQGKVSMGTDSLNSDWTTVFGYFGYAGREWGTVSGGYYNRTVGYAATISGGYNNYDDTSSFSVIGGGLNNGNFGTGATISGGGNGRCYAPFSALGGGSQNIINVDGSLGTISGGLQNKVDSIGGTVSGGRMNYAFGVDATVGGGQSDTAKGQFSTIAGGRYNSTTDDYASIGGGLSNEASHSAAVSGGEYNTAGGWGSAIPGGFSNSTTGTYSFASGTKAAANHNGTFVWADYNSAYTFPSIATNEFAARATGGVRFVSAIDGSGNPTAGVQLAAGGGSWSSLCDRSAKESFEALDKHEILTKLSQVPITSWRYRSQDETIRHIGPTAQDFHAAFGVGEDDKHITTIDADGVNMAAIQALYQMQQDLAERMNDIDRLQQRVAELEQTLNTIMKDGKP